MVVPVEQRVIQISVGGGTLEGVLEIPSGARAIVLFAHGSGSSRHSPRNRLVAAALREGGLATLLTDLLTPDEGTADAATGHLRFDIALLGARLLEITDWVLRGPDTRGMAIGYFGASTGAAAAVIAAADRPAVRAIVSRGGRPDLAGDALARVRAPTLLIVGERDHTVLALNRDALRALPAEKELTIVPGASHLFEEPGALIAVALLARTWFVRHLTAGEA